MSNNICYFELPVDDMARAQSFYQDIFGWSFAKMDGTPAEIDYWHINMGSSESGISCAGIMKRQSPEHKPVSYISVDSVETYLEKITQNKGTVIMPKTAVPGKGYFAIFLDPEHNPLGIWECNESA